MDKQILESLDKLNNISLNSIKLDDQIEYMELINEFFTNPMSTSIINSLKELKGIKKSRIPNP